VYPTTKDGAPIQDLTQADFEVVESGAPQKIEQFEHVVIRAAGPQDSRIEPNTVREARAMLESARARVFVIFLDIGHETIDGSHRMRQPLITLLNRLIGPDDLVGVMTPEMAPTDITFARKTGTIEGFLTRYWAWGESQQAFRKDPIERMYEACFPQAAGEMIERRRQKFTLDAFRDLAVFLRGVREERKAIVAISDGFPVVGPDPGPDADWAERTAAGGQAGHGRSAHRPAWHHGHEQSGRGVAVRLLARSHGARELRRAE
jgi:hypothetical protein